MRSPSSPAQFRISATSASVTASPIACRYWAETIFKASLIGDFDPESIWDSQNIAVRLPAAQSGFFLVPAANVLKKPVVTRWWLLRARRNISRVGRSEERRVGKE